MKLFSKYQWKKAGRTILPLFILTLLLSACSQERLVIPGTVGEGEALVTFSLRVPTATRSITLAQESEVKNIQILAFETTESKNLAYTAKSGNATANGQTTFGVNMRKGDWDLVVLANCSDVSLSSFIGQSQSDVLAALAKSVAEGTGWHTSTLQANGIPMSSAIIENQTVNEGASVPGINLFRAVARVNIAVAGEALATGKEFMLRSVRVYNYESKTKLFPVLDNGATQFEAASGSTRLGGRDASFPLDYLKTAYTTSSDGTVGADPTEIGFDDYYCNNIIYLNPAAAGSTAGRTTNTCMVIGGVYYGDRNAGDPDGEKVTYYRVDFSTNAGNTTSYLDIIRNHKYQFNITRVGGSGEETEEDAFDRGPVNMTVEVVPWDEGEIIEIINDGTYGLAISQNQYTFYADPVDYNSAGGDNELIIQTNFTGTWSVSCTDDDPNGKWLSAYIAGQGDEVSHPILSGSSSTSKALRTAVYLQLNKNESGTFRQGQVKISAGSLSQTVFVTQRGNSLHTLSVSTDGGEMYSSAGAVSEFVSGGGTRTFMLKSNTTWSIASSDVSWLTVDDPSSYSGGTDSGTDATRSITIRATNTAAQPRTGTITITTTSGDPVKFATITVNQAGLDPFLTKTSSENSYSLTGSSVSKTVTFNSNVSWTASTAYTNGSGWIAFTSPTTGSDSGSVSFTVAENTGVSTRVGTVTITGTGVVTPITLQITQAGGIVAFDGHTGWAGCNIYWDGTKLTFDDVNVTTHEQYQGVYFKYGSLVAISPMDSWVNQPYSQGSSKVLYAPVNKWGSNNVTWSNINSLTPIANTDLTRAYAYEKHNPDNNIGDICKYITDKGWAPAGKWRLPTSKEFDYGMLNNTQFVASGDFSAQTSAKGDGTYIITSGRRASANNKSGNTTPFIPVAGVRDDKGAVSLQGTNGNYWSSSPYTTSYGYSLSFGSSFSIRPSNPYSSSAGFAVRCVRQ